MTAEALPVFFFRPTRNKKDTGKAKDLPSEGAEGKSAEGERYICCRQCLQEITSPSHRIIVDGSYGHTFSNPHGIVYEIGCFRTVKGCGYAGSPTGEFTWFAGYSWRIVFCSMCLSHLGWLFEAHGKDGFHGLILNHLIQPE